MTIYEIIKYFEKMHREDGNAKPKSKKDRINKVGFTVISDISPESVNRRRKSGPKPQ